MAATADRPSVSLPLGISLNNGFGRPWFANAPVGSDGDGTITVIDPSGIPFANAPSKTAGGVFAGNLTNRAVASTGGLTAAAVATALATKSPDLVVPQRAVFFAALADGSIKQVHVEKGVDPLMPAGTFTPIPGISTAAAESSNPESVTRVGMIFNWVPSRILYVTDPLANRIVAINISDEGTSASTNEVFTATVRGYISSTVFDHPIDMAPAVPEVAARNFASNTTLGGGSDFYVLNRGDNSIVRMMQDGAVVAVRKIKTKVPGFRVNGLAVSEDARWIWVTATAPERQGVVLQMPTFGAGAVTTSLLTDATAGGTSGAVRVGMNLFGLDVKPEQALGPLFNGRACDSCHKSANGATFAGGMGLTDDTFVTRVARIEGGVFDPLLGHGGPIARQHSISELGFPCDLPTGTPAEANATSRRSAMTLRGTSLIDNIRIGDIDKNRLLEPAGVQGRLNILADGRVGKFGWKAQTATLVEFMGEAFRDEIGLTNPLAPVDLVTGCTASNLKAEADAAPLTSLVAFLNTIDPPAPTTACVGTATAPSSGLTLFGSIGCANCHKPSLPGPGNATPVFLFSDLLLHHMGSALADGFEQGSAGGDEFRTAPLWRVADRGQFLHDGRVRLGSGGIDQALRDAIAAHGGQAATAAANVGSLSSSDLQALLDFLKCI
jgi:hypothetical protein